MHGGCFYCHEKRIFFTFFVLRCTPGVTDIALTDRTAWSNVTLLWPLIGQNSQALSFHWSLTPIWGCLSPIECSERRRECSCNCLRPDNGSALSIISRPVRQPGLISPSILNTHPNTTTFGYFQIQIIFHINKTF